MALVLMAAAAAVSAMIILIIVAAVSVHCGNGACPVRRAPARLPGRLPSPAAARAPGPVSAMALTIWLLMLLLLATPAILAATHLCNALAPWHSD
jgi:hypothetical protein